MAFNFEPFFSILFQTNKHSLFNTYERRLRLKFWGFYDISSRFQDIGHFSCFHTFVRFLTIFNYVFKVEKMHSGDKFWTGVSFRTTILKFESFKKIGGGKLRYFPCESSFDSCKPRVISHDPFDAGFPVVNVC